MKMEICIFAPITTIEVIHSFIQMLVAVGVGITVSQYHSITVDVLHGVAHVFTIPQVLVEVC